MIGRKRTNEEDYMKMDKISQYKANGILKRHKMWLDGEEGGVYAFLYKDDLSDLNLSHCDLRQADLSYTNLRYVDLSYSDLSECDLSYADLTGAILKGATLTGAVLNGTTLNNVER